MGDYEKMDKDFMLQDALEDDSLWELLNVYADGEATPAEAAQIEALLRSDAAMKQDFDLLRFASTSLRAQPEMEPPTRLREAIYAATVSCPTLRRRLATVWADLALSRTPRYALAGGLAAAALAAVTFWPHADPTRPANGTAPLRVAAVPPIMNPLNHVLPPVAPLKSVTETPAKASAPTASKPAEKAAAPKPDATRIAKAEPTALKPAEKAAVKTSPPKKLDRAAPQGSASSTQAPAPIETPVMVASTYSPNPDMNRNNMRPASLRTAAEHDSPLPDDEKIAPTEAPAANKMDKTNKPIRVATKPERWEGHYIGPPPDARQFTPSYMRQQRQASNSGYNDLTLTSIRAKQISLGVEGRF